ncbi:hypothetical protein M404DRAFT_994509 [Pisolithus tinctorius Marx 270]|uniref:Uncharacterized protein n=1 Tax=Pisolithus tinctorius Marx 270 TaxID=870435 RepID=A0A0C3KQS5_PISTI|nr:hypothetical protein M404DRAFT_994509 [Pisolithus tinctorius Marx 270]
MYDIADERAGTCLPLKVHKGCGEQMIRLLFPAPVTDDKLGQASEQVKVWGYK